MLIAGFNSDNLLYLAGENEKTNQFELQSIASKALKEFKLDFSNHQKVIKDYTSFLIEKALQGEKSYVSILEILKNLCVELDYDSDLYDFYSLYFAQQDLKYGTEQWYWKNANRENISQIIKDYFLKRKEECK